MSITDVISGFTAAAPYATAIENLATLGIDITKVITPDKAQQYENLRITRLKDSADAVSALVANPESLDARQRINDIDDELCLAAGCPVVGGISGPTVTIGVDRLLAHEAIIADYARVTAILAELTLPAKQPS